MLTTNPDYCDQVYGQSATTGGIGRYGGLMAFDYPVVLDVDGVPVLVVGGGRVAARKAAGLAAAGAHVTVVAPEIADGIDAVARHRRAYETADLDRQRLVIVATGDPEVNARVAAEATARGLWVNAADDPTNCTFALPAIARRSPFTVAVSTGGATPAMASYVRDRIAAEVLTDRLQLTAEAIAAERAEMRARGESTEERDWREAIARLEQGPAHGPKSPLVT
jgi:siroheme synthase-like protein